MTKYNSTDQKYKLDPEDDAATVNLGAQWRMPTLKELQELKNCSLESTTMNEIKGYKVTSNKEGYTDASIFLPAAGYYTVDRNYTSVNNYIGQMTYYDSSERSPDTSQYRYFISFNLENSYYTVTARCYGVPVRPVTEF